MVKTQFVPKIMHQNLALDLWPMYYSKFNFKGLSVVGEQKQDIIMHTTTQNKKAFNGAFTASISSFSPTQQITKACR